MWGFRAFAGLLATLALAPSARGEMFSWVDGDGVLHLTNLKRPGASPVLQGESAEGFGGEKPRVLVMENGAERVVYPVEVTRYDGIFRRAAEHYRLPFALIKAVAKVESNFNERAVSRANARGLMQLIASTARSMKVRDVFNPEQNIFGGARYLRVLANRFSGNLRLTVAAYNAGPERVRRLGRVPRIRETQRYVKRVLTMYDYYRRSSLSTHPQVAGN